MKTWKALLLSVLRPVLRPVLLPVLLCAAIGTAAPAAAQNPETVFVAPQPAECDTMHVFRVWPGGAYTNRCPASTYVLTEAFYDRVLRDYNALPALQDARVAQREVTAVLEEKFVVLDSTYQTLLGLNRQLSDVSTAVLSESILSIDSTSQTLARTRHDLDAANAELKRSIRDLRRVRFTQFLRIAGAFAGGLVVGYFVGQ